MSNVTKGLRGYLPPPLHPDAVPVPSHVWCHELGEKVPIRSNDIPQWIAKTGMMFRCLVGSGVHGMAIAGTDDEDHVGICVEPPYTVIGSKRFDQYEFRTAEPDGPPKDGRSKCSGPDDLDLTVYSLRKYCDLAAAGNPTILIPLFVAEEHILYCNEFGRELQGKRRMFISKQAGERFAGYLQSQRRGLMGLRSGGTRNQGRQDIRDRLGFDAKFASHMIRLGVQGIELLTTGEITLPIPEPDLAYLRALKSGVYLEGAEPGSPEWRRRADEKKAETIAYAEKLERKIGRLVETSHLPDHPDQDAINDWLISVHYRFWKWDR